MLKFINKNPKIVALVLRYILRIFSFIVIIFVFIFRDLNLIKISIVNINDTLKRIFKISGFIGFIGLIISVCGFIFTVYTHIYPAQPTLEFNVITNTSILNISENVVENLDKEELLIVYKGKEKKAKLLKFIIVKITNIGTRDLRKEHFEDSNSYPAIKLKNGKYFEGLKVKNPPNPPEIYDSIYDSIKVNNDNNQIYLEPVLLKKQESFTIIFLATSTDENGDDKEGNIEFKKTGRLASGDIKFNESYKTKKYSPENIIK